MKKNKIAYIVFAAMFSCSCFAGFSIKDNDVKIDPVSRIANFVVTFNRQPDFLTLTNSGYPVDSFQYYIIDEVSQSFPGILNCNTVIRGDEIHSQNGVVIRDIFSYGPSEPGSGGFGPIQNIVDYQLNQTALEFSVGFDELGCPDGVFSYNLILTENGSVSDSVFVSDIFAVPTPSALILGLIGISGIIFKKNKKD